MHTSRPVRTHRASLGAVLICGSLLLAACGDDDTGTDAATGSDASTTAPVAEGAAFGPGCASVPTDGEGSFDGMADDPAATAASNNPVLSTLVEAVTAADLGDTLNGEGPFTVFAPTNDAFAAIPEETLSTVLADKELLTTILTYHVIGGQSYAAAALGEAGTAASVEGGELAFGTDGTTVNDVSVVCSDVQVGNGTVHIIDQVLLPPAVQEQLTGGDMDGEPVAAEPTGSACASVPTDGEGSFDGMADDPAATAASNNPVLSTLVEAVTAADLGDTLNGEGPFTIFAPTNDAFAAIPAADLTSVLADKDLLTSILTYHVVAGELLSSAELIEAGTFATVNGGELTIVDDGGVLRINDSASSVCMDVPTANATVHIIDAVLMPAA